VSVGEEGGEGTALEAEEASRGVSGGVMLPKGIFHVGREVVNDEGMRVGFNDDLGERDIEEEDDEDVDDSEEAESRREMVDVDSVGEDAWAAKKDITGVAGGVGSIAIFFLAKATDVDLSTTISGSMGVGRSVPTGVLAIDTDKFDPAGTIQRSGFHVSASTPHTAGFAWTPVQLMLMRV
jgi:hypothetical protein